MSRPVVQPRAWIGADTVERQVHAAAVAAVAWDDYRKCPTCLRPMGVACVSLSGYISGGRPDGVEQLLEHPHVARRRRSGR